MSEEIVQNLRSEIQRSKSEIDSLLSTQHTDDAEIIDRQRRLEMANVTEISRMMELVAEKDVKIENLRIELEESSSRAGAEESKNQIHITSLTAEVLDLTASVEGLRGQVEALSSSLSQRSIEFDLLLEERKALEITSVAVGIAKDALERDCQVLVEEKKVLQTALAHHESEALNLAQKHSVRDSLESAAVTQLVEVRYDLINSNRACHKYDQATFILHLDLLYHCKRFQSIA